MGRIANLAKALNTSFCSCITQVNVNSWPMKGQMTDLDYEDSVPYRTLWWHRDAHAPRQACGSWALEKVVMGFAMAPAEVRTGSVNEAIPTSLIQCSWAASFWNA